MRRLALSAAGLAAIGLVAGAMLFLVDRPAEHNGARRGSRSVAVPTLAPGGVRGCRERIEGRFLRPDPERDTVIGPITFTGLPRVYREYLSRPADWQPYPGVGMPAMKIITLVRADARMTLIVPRRQRPWMRTLYAKPLQHGEHAITLQACRRVNSRRAARRECGWGGKPPWNPHNWACRLPYTQFNGGLAIDFAKAPKHGLCAELTVRAEAEHKTFRGYLFRPASGGCHTPHAGPPAKFKSLPPGWRQFRGGDTTLGSRGGIAETVVTSWRFDPSQREGPARDLPPGGILMTVILIRRGAGGHESPTLCRGTLRSSDHPRIKSLPLHLPTRPATTLEGSEQVPEFRVFGSIRNDYDVEVRVDINQRHPSRALLRRAQLVLSRLHLPAWPNRC